MNAHVPAIKASIYDIESHRTRALALYEEAFDKLQEAVTEHAVAAAQGGGNVPSMAFGSFSNATTYGRTDRTKFLDRVRQEVDRGIWGHIINSMKLESLMDHKAREEFRQQLRDNPPPATAENCAATLERFIEDADTIFKRGVANAFSGLDRRFRSHDGFKIGGRIVLTYAFADGGYMNSRAQEIIRDVERAFYVMDGKGSAPDYMEGICGKVPRSGFSRSAFVVEDDYFTLKGFKNGNAHLWFKRDDLLERVNGILADWYGATLGEGADAADKQAGVRSTAVAKNMGFFETPTAVARKVMEQAQVWDRQGYRQAEALTILEPSAGAGALARLAATAGHLVTCVELHPGRATELRLAVRYDRVVEEDFLALSPHALGKFDRVIMNPPFDRGLDIDHVRHAFKFLKPGGILCAVMSASTEFREDARAASFREWAERFRFRTYGGRLFEDLPAGSFKESGTMVNTCLVTLRAPDA